MEPARHLLRICVGWLPLLFALLSAPSVAAPLIKLSTDFSQVDLVQYADMVADTSRQLTIEQITHEPAVNNFSPANSALFRHIDRSTTYWMRFGIDNPSHQARIIVLNLKVPDEFPIAAFDGSLQTLSLHRAPLLQLTIPPQSKQLFYLRIGPGAIETSQIELLSIERYLATYRAQSWFNGVLQGGLLLIAIGAILVGSLRRDSTYWWLAGHCLTLAAFQVLYRSDFNPFTFNFNLSAPYRRAVLQTCLLLWNICSTRIAQRLPIVDHARSYCNLLLKLLMISFALAIPLAFVLQPPNGGTVILMLSALNAMFTGTIALYNFLLSHRRELFFYAVLRTSLLLLTFGGGFAWHTNSSFRSLTDGIVPIVMAIEAIGLFGILLWRSFEQQLVRARGEREIAVLEVEARSRTEIIAEVAHRVRTPASGVLGMLDMLQDTALSTTQLDYLGTIRRASNELLNVIDEISDVNRLQTHALNLQQNIFDPHALVTECADGFRSAAAAHRIELINDISPELPPYVSGDLTRLRQILLQLLQQAVSQHEFGEIVLSVKQTQRDWLKFDIQTRAARATSAPSEIDRRVNPPDSTYVRFAIARQLVQNLGGRIHIEELANGNSHTRFELPLLPIERNVPSGIRDTTLQDKYLLIIDDNATFCDVLQRQLTHWGMTVYIAHSLSEGLARLRNQITLQQPIDVLLLDSDMPEWRQSDWSQRLHNEITPPPITIFLSSETSSRAEVSVPASRRILLKPINHTSLKITLIEAFKQREQRLLPKERMRNEPIRCLFAEDNLINAKVLAGMLDKLGVTYTATNNGQEAVDACRRDRFDIVLMDWDMPVMDGREASRRIRDMFENRGLPSVPIIALTANTVEELGERAGQLVMDAHLVKPIQLQNLRELLEQWTGKIITLASDLPH